VYAANSRLYLRSLSAFESVAVPGSEGKTNPTNLAFSRDGRWIAFWSDLIIKRIAVDGGTPLPIVPASAAGTSFDWGAEGIVFAQGLQGIHRIAVNGGTPQQLVTVKDEGAFNPHLLPGGDAVLFTQTKVTGDARWDTAQIVLQSLKSGERKTLVDGTGARYLPTGHLLYAVGGTVFAAPFDLKKQKITGEAVPVIEGVRRASRTGQSDLSVSDTGILIYVPGSATPSSLSRRLIVMDRSGSVTPLPLPSGPYSHPRVSRDGKHAAVAIDDGQNAYVSVFELPAAATLRRLTFEGHNRFPVWSGDSQSIAFQSDRDGDSAIFIQRADGSSPRAELLTKADAGTEHVPEAWSPDGKTLLFSAKKNGIFSLLMFSFESRQISAFGNVQSRNPISASFSPDGHWIAYSSFGLGSGRGQNGARNPDAGVYVEPFPATNARYQVPKEFFDFHPVWSPTSAELFYIPSGSRFSAVPVHTQPSFAFGKAESLPIGPTRDRINSDVRGYDVMPDGRFLSTLPADEEEVSGTNAAAEIRVVFNWLEELKQRVPVK